MIFNYIKIALRNILRNKTYSIINILGLTIGITASILILLFVKYHLGFDKHVENHPLKYRIIEIQQAQGVGEQHVAFTMGPLARQMEADFPQVKQACRVMSWGGGLLEYNMHTYENNQFAFADSNVFDMLSIKMILGNPATALHEKGSMCLSESMAKKIFGTPAEALDKIIIMNQYGPVKVTGVFEDIPEQSHYFYHVLCDYNTALAENSWLENWFNNSMTTYVEFNKGTNIQAFEASFRDYLLQFAPENYPPERVYRFYLQAYEDIHLNSAHLKFQYNRNMGNLTYVIVLGIVGLALLLIACINYINLSIARSVKRSREVGMRKVLGATREKLVYQFLGESFIITSLSIVLSLGLLEIILPEFRAIMRSEIYFSLNLEFILILLSILTIVSFLSGFYPAIFLSRFNPAMVLKGQNNKGLSSGKMTRSLVGFQFFVSTTLIAFIIITHQQVNFVKTKDLGINYNNVVTMPIYHTDNPENYKSFKAELENYSQIKGAAYTSYLSGAGGSQSSMTLADTSEQNVTVRICSVDEDFIPIMDIPLVAGRNFFEGSSTDSISGLIVNEALVNYFGWKDPIGKRFKPFDSDTNRVVIGVVADYHYYSLHSKIEPAVFLISPYRMGYINVKISGIDQETTLDYIEEKWNAFFPGKPLNIEFANEMILNNYNETLQTLTLFTVFVFISIFISALGLFGLSSLYVERKTKEIAIRKVLGGSVIQINTMIIRNFAILIVIAGILAIPVSYKLIEKFLNEFAYRVDLSWYYFAAAVAISLVLGTLTVLIKSLRASYSNPVKTLKYE